MPKTCGKQAEKTVNEPNRSKSASSGDLARLTICAQTWKRVFDILRECWHILNILYFLCWGYGGYGGTFQLRIGYRRTSFDKGQLTIIACNADSCLLGKVEKLFDGDAVSVDFEASRKLFFCFGTEHCLSSKTVYPTTILISSWIG